MAYITRKELELAAGGEERLRQLTDDDEPQIASAIRRAEGTAHKYLGRLYGIPLELPVDDDILQLIADEAVYHLMRRRGMVPQEESLAHEERIKEFQAYGEGKVASPTGALKSKHVRNRSSAPSEERAVSRSALKGFS